MTLEVGEVVHVQEPHGQVAWLRRDADYVVIGLLKGAVAVQKRADMKQERVRDFLLGDLLVHGDPLADARVTFLTRVVRCSCGGGIRKGGA